MQRMIVILAIMALSSSPPFASEPLPPFAKYTCEGFYFRALVPSTWMRSDRNPPYADMTRVAGAKFEGTPNGEDVPASISLYWYSGERSFTTPDSYINARLGSMAREDAERGRATFDAQVAGRKATGFKMKTFELVMLPHDRLKPGKDDGPIVYELAPPSRKVIMDDQYIVLPASKGYFVLHYRAPESIVEANRPIFDKVIASFEPLVP
jgi:hypothetical protein